MTAAQLNALNLDLRCNPNVSRIQRVAFVAAIQVTNDPSVDYEAWQADVYSDGLGTTVHAY